MSFFTQNPPGAVSETLSAGASEAYPIIRGITVDLWPTAINFLVAIISIAFLNLWMAGGLTIMIIAYAALAVWRTRINRKREERIRPYTEKQTRNWITALTYQDLIKQFSRQEDTEAELAILYKEIVEINRQRAVAMTWIWMGQEFLWKLAVVMVYGYGGYLVLVTKTLKIGDLILFVAFMDRAMGPLSYILDIYDNMQVGLVSVERMFKIWDKPIEVKDEPNAGKLIIDKATVRFKNVNFYYRDKNQISLMSNCS